MTNKDDIAALKKELADLKAALAPPVDDREAVGRWRDQMRAASEARASVMHPSVVRDLAVLPDDVVRGVVHDNRAPQGPSSQGAIPSSQQVSNVHTGGGGNRTGWQNPIPLSPPPGIGYVDMLARVDAEKQRGAAMVQEARRKVVEEKVADEKTNL